MLIHTYHSNNDDSLTLATLGLGTFSKYRPLLDNDHVRQDALLGLGQDSSIYYALAGYPASLGFPISIMYPFHAICTGSTS